MTKIGHCMLIMLALLTPGVAVRAQETPSRESSRTTGPAVTISVTERGVRFAALGSFGKMRLEVFNADGTSLYNSDFAAASVRDWALDDKDGQYFPDGTYLCVITIRDLSGRLTTKQGSVVLKGGQASLQMADGEVANVVEQDRSLAPVSDQANTAATLIAHDGKNGQVVSTRGALTFRFGDFFSGKDKEQMRLTEEGNLGIGTSEPEFKLDVAGEIRAQQGFVFGDGSTLNMNKGALMLTNSNGKGVQTLININGNSVPSTTGSGTQNKLAKWTDNSGTLGDSGVSEVNGNVGIGTTTAGIVDGVDLGAYGQKILHVLYSGVARVSVTGSGGGSVDFIDSNASANQKWFVLQNIGGKVYYRALSDGATINYDLMTFDLSNGYVGIGKTSPQSPLDVNGNLNVTGNATVSGNIAAKYQDIAEWTSGPAELSSGTVVSLDTSKPNSVKISNKAYDTRVAGVVSAQPGVVLGEAGPNRVLVATTGRVKVRVSANRHPIQIGDLLVTSNTPGLAMKSQPFRVHGQSMHRPGTIVGKALESLENGDGTILVLLSLQ